MNGSKAKLIRKCARLSGATPSEYRRMKKVYGDLPRPEKIAQSRDMRKAVAKHKEDEQP